MDKESTIRKLKEDTKARREKYLEYKEEAIKTQKRGSKSYRSKAQAEMDKINQNRALNKGYAWACRRAFADPLDRILDEIERASKGI